MSTYEMKLKLRPVIDPDKRRQYMTPSLWLDTLYLNYRPETNFICQGVWCIYVITLYHVKKLENGKGLTFSVCDLVNKLKVVLKNCSLSMRR